MDLMDIYRRNFISTKSAGFSRGLSFNSFMPQMS